ncbi:MAG: LysR family transcriptional regulator [Myxococcales bacterium]|nr:LysR family transcriptional regulator [Myxococcales bacterium]
MNDELSAQPILDGELLRAFAAFATARSFTHAAARVGLSQPALFERVRRLQEQLGVTLYEREGRALRLTDAGVRVAAFAREELARARGFSRALTGAPSEERVTLAAGEGAYLYLLGPALRAFTRRPRRGPKNMSNSPSSNTGPPPRCELRVLTLGGPSALEAVREGEAALAVGVFDLVPRGLLARDILQTPLCAAVLRTSALARRREIPLRALARARLILAPTGQRHRAVISRAIASLGVQPAPPVTADGWPLMLQFAAAGLGVAVVNGVCKPPPGVVLRPIPELGTVTYRLLSRRDSTSAAAERLAALILERSSSPRA